MGSNVAGKAQKEASIYEIRWHGRGRTLMSRSYCRSRSSVQKYIDSCIERCNRLKAYHVLTKGNSPDYFETIDKNDYDSGISIRKVKAAISPFNMLEDRFEDLKLLSSCKFLALLDSDELKSFAKQEEQDIKSGNKLYSRL